MGGLDILFVKMHQILTQGLEIALVNIKKICGLYLLVLDGRDKLVDNLLSQILIEGYGKPREAHILVEH